MLEINHFDERFMRRAISLAKMGAGNVAPNPMVGCVITRDQKIIAEGYHQAHGSNHAEINAINSAIEKGDNLVGATLFSSLEPCCHTKKITGPCTERIKQYEFERIVIGCLDPNPQVAGSGVRNLKEAGYKVDCGILQKECENLIRIFRKNIIERRPYILLKSAITLDGKIANSKNQSKWITDQNARKEVHILRKELGAILIGRGTLEKDDPSLTIRHIESNKGMRRILVGNIEKLKKPISEYKLFGDQTVNPTIVITPELFSNSENAKRLGDLGVDLIYSSNQGAFGNDVLSSIYNYGITSVMVEGGAHLMSSLIKTGNYDELCLFVAPFMIGNGMSFYDNKEIIDINEIPRLQLESSEKIGNQLLLRYLR